MGVTLRYDLLANSKNGGGGGGIALNGNGWTRATVSASTRTASRSRRPAAAWLRVQGAVRQDVALDLLFYPTQQITVKVEYRHDWAKVFLRNDGSYGKSNDLLATQFIYSF